MKKIGVLRGCFGRWFAVCLQKQKSPHLIGQKIAVLMGVPLEIYNLFTDRGHPSLNGHRKSKNAPPLNANLQFVYGTQCLSSNRTKKWRFSTLEAKGLHFVYRIQLPLLTLPRKSTFWQPDFKKFIPSPIWKKSGFWKGVLEDDLQFLYKNKSLLI